MRRQPWNYSLLQVCDASNVNTKTNFDVVILSSWLAEDRVQECVTTVSRKSLKVSSHLTGARMKCQNTGLDTRQTQGRHVASTVPADRRTFYHRACVLCVVRCAQITPAQVPKATHHMPERKPHRQIIHTASRNKFTRISALPNRRSSHEPPNTSTDDNRLNHNAALATR